MTSLAEYNNNPGNIRPAKGVNYEGMIGIDDKGFAVFEKPEHGQKALINDITYKLEKRGIKTPNDFVDIYSPKGDPENTEDGRDNYKIYMAHVLGLKSTSDPFPENSIQKIAQAITKFEAGTWQQEDADKKAGEKPNAATIPEGEKIPPASTEAGSPPEVERGFIGSVVGGTTAATVEAGKRFFPLIPNVFNAVVGRTPNPALPMSRASLQTYLNSQIADDLRLSLKDLEKVSGSSKPIRTMSEVQGALNEIKGTPGERVGKTTSVNPRTGRPQKIYSTTPGKPAVDLSAFKHTPTIASHAADQAMHGIDIFKSALPSVAKVGVGALGGGLAAIQGYDAFELAKKIQQDNANGVKQDTFMGMTDDERRLAAKSMSALGGAMAVVPTGLSQGAGLVLQAPELAYQGYEGLKALNKRIKSTTREDADRALTNVDIMGNPF